MIETSGNNKIRQQIIKIVIENGIEPWLNKANWNEVSDIMDLTPELVRGQYRRLVNWLVDNNVSLEEYIENLDMDNIKTIIINKKENKFDELVDSTGVDQELFEVEKGSIWGSLYNMSASFKFRRRTVPTKVQVDKIIKQLDGHFPKKFTPIKRSKGEHMALISMYDLQLGRRGFDGTGIEYTVEKYEEILDDLLSSVSMYSLEEIVFVLGNDFSDADTPFGTTTKGTQQYSDVSWRYSIDKQCDVATHTINLLRQVAPVKVIMVGGNHDMMSNYFLGKYVEAYYKEAKDVDVDNLHATRKFYKYGNTGIMFTHGNEEKTIALPAIFATEGADIFSTVTNREVHTGHYHQRSDNYNMLTEEFGVYVRVLPSLSPASEWENLKGYILHNRAGLAHVYHKDKNQVAEFYGKI